MVTTTTSTPTSRTGSASAQRLRFLRWVRTAAGLRVLCRCACGRLAVVRAGDFAHERVRCCSAEPLASWAARQ
jgi:hypothetical protein